MKRTVITTDGGDVQVTPPQGTYALSPGDAWRIVELLSERTDLDPATEVLVKSIQKWIFPDVWLVGRPDELPRIISIRDMPDSPRAA